MNARMTALGSTTALAILLAMGGCAVAPVDDGNNNTNTNGNSNTNDNADNANDNTDNMNDNTGGAKLVVFSDDAPGSTFLTTDVRDVEDEIVQFDEDTRAIVWKATGESFQVGSWTTNGNFLGTFGSFQVRFGTVNGERRAYFTETGPATICDIEVSGSFLSIFATSVTVPQE